jgi:hypothetical protein
MVGMDVIEQDLLNDIMSFCASHGMSPTRFGMSALGDPGLVATLERGRECRRATRLRIRSFMAEQDALRDERIAAAHGRVKRGTAA